MGKPEQHDFAPRYGGRIVSIELYANTDEDVNKLAKRVQKAARGVKLAAVVCMAKVYTGADALEVWNKLAEMSATAHAHPNAKPFSYDDED